jgi:rod shape-determining protein MreB
MLGKKVAVDLGTQSVRLLVKGEGSIVSEPAVVTRGGGVQGAPGLFGVAALRAAAEDGALRTGRPMASGSVADASLLRLLIAQVMVRAVGRQRIFKPDVVVAVMAALPGDDRRLILDAAMNAGARTVYLIDSVMAGAIGAGVPVTSPSGHLAIDIGAGKTDVAVIAMESTIARSSLAGHGGERLAAAVSARVRQLHGVTMPAQLTEDVVASLLRVGIHEERRLSVTGRGDETAKASTVTSTELSPVVDEYLRPIVAAIHEVLRETPQALLDDIHREGIMMFGGGSRLEGLDRHLSTASGIRVRVDRDPQLAVIRGAGYALDNLDVLKRNFMYIR